MALLEILSKVDLLLYFSEIVLKSAKQLKTLVVESSDDSDADDLHESQLCGEEKALQETQVCEEDCSKVPHVGKKRKADS